MRNQSAITMIQSPGNEKTIGMVTRRFSSSSPHAEIGVGTNHTIGECRAAGPGRSRAPMTMRLSASHLIMFPMIETQGLIVELSTGCHRGRHSPCTACYSHPLWDMRHRRTRPGNAPETTTCLFQSKSSHDMVLF